MIVVRNALLNQLVNNSEFLQTFSPYQFLKDDQNKLDTLLNRIELAEFLNLLFTASPPDFETVCRCLKNRHQMNSNYAPLMRAFVVDSASLMNLFLAMEMTNYGDLIPSLAARLGFENLEIEEAKNELYRYVYGNNGNGSNLKRLFDELYIIDEGFRDCGPSVSNFLFKLHTDQPNKLIELLVVIPELRDMFYRTASSDGFDCSYSFSHDDMASLMSNNYPEISWNKLIDAFGTNTILSYFVNNQSSYFMNQAVLYNKSILTNTQQNQNLYGGNYGGLENYFTYIRNYFGQGLYDQITAGFMQQSSVYTDSLRLEEWHMYGSSRIGIYQTNKAMAQRTVRIENGVTTQLSNTHIEQLGRVALLCIHTERGAKRYELTNHLGNVLTVVTDKKLPVCSGTGISYFIADVVSATDYSPFGAPLAERTWQGGAYRYGFNYMEKDNEINGIGNSYDFGARIYDSRLGRWFTIDPMFKKYSNESNYIFTSGNPILYIDKEGKDKIVSYTVMTDKGTAKFDVVTKDDVMFTYVEKSDQMGNAGAGYFTFTDIRQTVVLDFRTNIKPSENKTSISEEFSGKELGLVEGGQQMARSVLEKSDKFITGPGGTQPGGIAFTTPEGGASATKQTSESPVAVIDINTLLIYAGATHFGNSSLPKIKEEIGVAEFIDKLNNTNEARKGAKPKDSICIGCKDTVTEDGHNGLKAVKIPVKN